MLGFTPYAKLVDIKEDVFIEGLLKRAAEVDALPEPPLRSPSCNNLINELIGIVS